MIEELGDEELFSLDTSNKRINSPEDALPCSCYTREGCECRENALNAQSTDVSHVSITVNSVQNVSTLSMLHPQSTMLRFHDVENLGQYRDLSRDQEERARFESLGVPGLRAVRPTTPRGGPRVPESQ
jgi:hypothetical protein